MSEDLKTIKELADEIGVSKQAVWQKIKKESSIDLIADINGDDRFLRYIFYLKNDIIIFGN